MPENELTATTPPGCAPTNGSEVQTPRTNAASLIIEAGDWRSEKDCTNYALDLAKQLEQEAVSLAEGHRTMQHEAMEMSDELDWSKQNASDALRERDAARTRAKDYFNALELAAKERDDWRKCADWLAAHIVPHSDDCKINRFALGDSRRTMANCDCDQGLAIAEYEHLKIRDAGLPNS